MEGSPGPTIGAQERVWSGVVAALLWIVLAVRWFDDAAALRPGWLEKVPARYLAAATLLLAFLWIRSGRARLQTRLASELRKPLWLVVGIAILFRLPLAWWGAEGYTTADGSLSGIMAVQIRNDTAHHVFVPSVSYSGSLKSHVTAWLAPLFGMTRAFALASVLFYAAFVAAVFWLAALLGGLRAALAAGVWAAFAPTFVTWYSLSNDGNYVEVLALGTWALLLVARLAYERDERARAILVTAAGLLLGAAFWAHILAIAHIVAVGLAVVAGIERAAALRSLVRLGAGFVLGYLPALLWNARHEWASFQYLIPGRYWDSARYVAEPGGPVTGGPSFIQRLGLAITDHAPVLMGYDAGYPRLLDTLVRALAWLGVLTAAAAVVRALFEARRSRRFDARAVLLIFTAANVLVALVALPHIPGNPRYLLFLAAPIAVFLATWARAGWRRVVLAVSIGFGALGSLGQAREKLRVAGEWRAFVATLERVGVKHCYSDYYQAARITFFSEERIVCSSKLGPTATEYFLEYRDRVGRAAAAAIVAVNAHSADRMERKLRELGVSFERLDSMKPVLLRLSRKVDPQELFPGRDLRPR
jgi:hypothetical protein